ncbi:MAG: DUF4276 family protein [Chloroflexi bacterium]|nr:DUF4276 family protein [Chloroflexota bacterium]
MVTVRIFIEGGGSGKISDKVFKEAWTKFFTAAGLTGRMPKIVRGEGRSTTFRKFRTAHRRPSELLLLLVDSEGPVADGHSAWQHLRARLEDNWEQPLEAGDNSAYLMVQVMETWFLADRDALRRFFGPSLNENSFGHWPNLEEVHKDTVLDALERATSNCQKPYRKGKVSFELLGRVDPQLVAAACPHANQLLTYLRTP